MSELTVGNPVKESKIIRTCRKHNTYITFTSMSWLCKPHLPNSLYISAWIQKLSSQDSKSMFVVSTISGTTESFWLCRDSACDSACDMIYFGKRWKSRKFHIRRASTLSAPGNESNLGTQRMQSKWNYAPLSCFFTDLQIIDFHVYASCCISSMYIHSNVDNGLSYPFCTACSGTGVMAG